MPRAIRRLVPSMFSRRLLFLAAVAVALTLILAARLSWLTIAEGAARRKNAEEVLTSTTYPRTARGRILDCKGRILAEDKACYDVAVHYSVITGEWAYDHARRDARNADKEHWGELSAAEQEDLIGPYQQTYDEQIGRLWQTLGRLGHTDEAELAERRQTIERRVQQLATHVWVERRARIQRQTDRTVPLHTVARPILEQDIGHAIVPAVGPRELVEIQRHIDAARETEEPDVWTEVSVIDSKRRDYPLETASVSVTRQNLPGDLKHDDPVEIDIDGLAFHIIGDLRSIEEADLDPGLGRPFAYAGRVVDLGGYRPGDLKGRRGIERSFEHLLRGARGKRVKDRVTDMTIIESSKGPAPGHDMTLSLDIQLQARVQALMSHDKRIGLMRRQRWHYRNIPDEVLDNPLNGAAVVMDVATGQIRAAVTVPGVSRETMDEDYETLLADPAKSLLCRPIQMSYQPGSTVKPMVLCAAMAEGKITSASTIDCQGMLNPARTDELRCWIYKSSGGHHGPLTGAEAIKHSCNVFFFTLGRWLGGGELVNWYYTFGLGNPTGCGLKEEVGGLLPEAASTQKLSRRDGIMMAIGQGDIQWTPVQAAAAYATIATKGQIVWPTFMVNPPDNRLAATPLRISAGAAEALLGMYKAANDERGGTAHHLPLVEGRPPIFDIEDVRIMAKSGTAATGKKWDVAHVVQNPDHAWTICLAQRPGSKRPDFVIVVVVEDGGSGGSVAGPIVNQILHEMRAEGYL